MINKKLCGLENTWTKISQSRKEQEEENSGYWARSSKISLIRVD